MNWLIVGRRNKGEIWIYKLVPIDVPFEIEIQAHVFIERGIEFLTINILVLWGSIR